MTKTLGGLLVVLLFLGSPGAAGGAKAGHAAFFYFERVQSGAYSETHDDFVFFYQGALSWLDAHGITHSYHARRPVRIERTQRSAVIFQDESLSGDLGTILLKQDGSYRILYGVYTDVDLMSEIKEFFGLEHRAE